MSKEKRQYQVIGVNRDCCLCLLKPNKSTSRPIASDQVVASQRTGAVCEEGNSWQETVEKLSEPI